MVSFDAKPSCQISLNDDWLTADADALSTIDVLANDTTACGGELRVFAANAIPPPEDWETDPSRRLEDDDWEQWWCGPPQTEEDYNVTFIPNDGFRGDAFCTYQACDGSTCQTATIYIDVSAPITSPPTNYPTRYPTPNPTKYPTPFPTKYPTPGPTKDPTPEPTNYPTPLPTKYPTPFPTKYPTPYPTKYPTNYPTKYPTNYPTKYPTPFPTKYPTPWPTNYPTKNPTNYPTKYPTTHPTRSPIIPVTFDVPIDSFYCGVTFNHASDLCGVACPGGNGDCPPGLKCYGNTPCGDKKSFFCGSSYDDANDKCTDHCPSGSENECPSGQSCFAYTMCRFETDDPTEEPTWAPSDDPTKRPTPFPTKYPTPFPTKYPTPFPTKYPTKYPTEDPTPSPTELMKQNLGGNPDESDNLIAGLKPKPAEEEEDAPDESNFQGQLKPTKPDDEEQPPEEPPEEEEEPPKEEPPLEEPPKEQPPKEQPPKEEPPKEQPPAQQEPTPDQSDALVIEIKPCEDPLAMTVNQAYWRSWSSDRPESCNKFEASDIDATTYTHLVYSFASISADGMLEPWVGSWDEVDKYKEFNKVKERNSKVKTIIAVTEGIFYGAGMNPVTFHEVAETLASRMAFAQSVVSFLDTYGFDGLDIDWESPLDRDKGGDPKNYERFVLLAEEIRNALDSSGKDYIFTIALPPTDWELYDYDVVGLSEHVDWFNLMTFDYHTPKNRPKTVGAHSDLKLIDYVVSDLLKETRSIQFVLGMAAYGRTYTMADDRCKELGCPFRSPGLGGCAKTPGFLPFKEIQTLIEEGSYNELHQDVSSSSMVAVVGGDQMLSFDDETTWAIKEDYAEMMCLRGTMLWSIDMLKPNTSHQDPDGGGRKLLSDSDSSDSCDICGPGGDMQLLESQQVSYAGANTTCGDISTSFHLNAKEFSFKCSVARTSLASSCCAETCQMCPSGSEINGDAMIMHEGEEVSCADYDLALKTSGSLQGSNECDSSTSLFSETCCSSMAEDSRASLDATPSSSSCNICVKDSVHHELKSEAMVEYKGTSISCLDINSILAKSEAETSDICMATQSMLFDGCCYEKCSLCGEKSLRWDARVRFNNQILSCDEMDSMFTLGMIRDGSDQCDSMQSAYSSVCCFDPPKNKCELCSQGSELLDVNTHSFVKTRSSSLHCTTLVNSLAETEEEGSATCVDSKSAYSSICCNSSSQPSLPSREETLYHDWFNDDQPSSTSDAVPLMNIFWSFIMIIPTLVLTVLSI
jgi:chitinase